MQEAPLTRTPSTFWSWFAENAGRLRESLESALPVAFAEIHYRFHKAYPELVWDVVRADDGTLVLSVSAGGRRELFPRVFDVVREAPRVAGWRVRAFRARGKANATITSGSISLSSDDVRWAILEPRAGDEGAALGLFVRGLDDENRAALGRAAMMLVDEVVGEWTSVMRIGAVAFGALTDEVSPHAAPLAELAAALDGLAGPVARAIS